MSMKKLIGATAVCMLAAGLAFAGELNGDQAGVLIARVWALRDALNLKGLMENIHEQ